jgi:hypothetical protein
MMIMCDDNDRVENDDDDDDDDIDDYDDNDNGDYTFDTFVDATMHRVDERQ